MVHIFDFIITTYLKNFIGIKCPSSKQCQAELSPSLHDYIACIFHLKKNCSPYELPCPSLEPLRETLYIGGESHPSAKKCSFLAPENPPRQTTIFMQSPNISIIYSCSHCCCIIFLTPGFMYRYIMLILISRWLLNLIFSMRKASNGQISNHLIPPSLHFSMQFEKHCFNYCLFTFSFSPFFIFFSMWVFFH